MSLDYTVYAKTQKRTMRAVRAAAKVVMARNEDGLKCLPPEDERDEDELWIEGLDGPIQVSFHTFGVALSISSTSGARRDFTRLGELAEEIAEKLGTVLEEHEALELLAEEDEAESPRPPPPSKPHGAAILLVDRVVVVLIGAEGEQVHRATTSIPQFDAQRGDKGQLWPRLIDQNAPAILSEEGRRSFAAKRLRCTVHGKSGEPVRCYDYELDADGRVVSSVQTK